MKCEGDNQLTQISGCVCTGYNVTFTCSIVGGGNTIWNGTAFDCPSGTNIFNNQIFLRHSAFGMLGEPNGTCSDRAIIGEGVSVESTRFTSRLIVRVNSDIVGKNVSCIYDDSARGRETLIGIKTIELTSGGKFWSYGKLGFQFNCYLHIPLDDLSQPTNISLVKASPSELMFKWSSVTHDCSALHYDIMMTSTDCGNCPMIVNHTTAICAIQKLQPNEVRMCSFRVQAVLCDNIFGQSGEASFRLKGT